MKNILILTVCCLIFNSCSQDLRYTISETYENGYKKVIDVISGDRLVKKVYYLKDGSEQSVEEFEQNFLVSRWILGIDKSSLEYFKDHFGNGSLKKAGYYDEDMQSGRWAYYNRSNHLEAERYFFKDQPTGIWAWYDHSGEMIDSEDHGNIKSNGQFIEYYRNGSVKAVSFYNDGTLDGMHVTYHDNGNVKTNGQYLNNYQNGVWTWLSQDGKLERVESYDRGLPNGVWKQYHPNGQVKFQGKYLQNQRTGQWVWYDLDGKSTRSEVY